MMSTIFSAALQIVLELRVDAEPVLLGQLQLGIRFVQPSGLHVDDREVVMRFAELRVHLGGRFPFDLGFLPLPVPEQRAAERE